MYYTGDYVILSKSSLTIFVKKKIQIEDPGGSKCNEKREVIFLVYI